MIGDRRVIAVIPARGGSKGIPRKNVREVGGKPMIAWTIEAAKQSKYVDRVVLSSDDDEIIEVAKRFGCEVPFVRPDELAGDHVSAIEPAVHMLQTLPESYDYLVLLQPTVPLRTSQDIDGCIERCVQMSAPCCVSVTVPDKSPYIMYKLNDEDRIRPLLEAVRDIPNLDRQNLPTVYLLNGAVYVAESEWFQRTQAFLSDDTVTYAMPRERSMDLDHEEDLVLLNHIISRQRGD